MYTHMEEESSLSLTLQNGQKKWWEEEQVNSSYKHGSGWNKGRL